MNMLPLYLECALILLQCDIDIFQNVEFASKEGSKLNIFTLMATNGWKGWYISGSQPPSSTDCLFYDRCFIWNAGKDEEL